MPDEGMAAAPTIRAVTGTQAGALIPALADLLIDCVDNGASVGFLLPLARDRAAAYWSGIVEAVTRGERILLAAEADGAVVGTVHLVLALPENQPHRADVAKMLVHGRARRQGIGNALMRAAEDAARRAGKTLLVLDTASADAERLYIRRGWTRAGTIPDFALLPDGRPCATTFFYKAV
jgi:GNAT superfamily N-acetyltransferase